MTYTVEYKLKGQIFWRKITRVKGDLIAKDVPGNPRILILENETRVEIPIIDTMFRFSNERFLVIKQNMEKDAGQQIPVSK